MDQQKTADTGALTDTEKDAITVFETLLSAQHLGPLALRSMIQIATTKLNTIINPRLTTPKGEELDKLFKYYPNVFTSRGSDISYNTDVCDINGSMLIREDEFFEKMDELSQEYYENGTPHPTDLRHEMLKE